MVYLAILENGDGPKFGAATISNNWGDIRKMGWTATNKWHGDLWFRPILDLEPLKVAIHLLRKKNRHGTGSFGVKLWNVDVRCWGGQRPLHLQFWNIN